MTERLHPPVVLLDYGGTLDSDGLSWKDRFSALLGASGPDTRSSEFDRAFYAADDALVGTISPDASLSETVGRLADNLVRELPRAEASAIRSAASRFLSDSFAVLRRNSPLLSAIGRGRRLAIVSNGYGNMAGIVSEAGLSPLFDAVVDSAAVGVAKPDPRIFRIALEALGASPGDAVMVGDSRPRDMEGARNCGIAHVWLRSAGRVDLPCCRGDRMIASLSELAGALG